MPIFLSFDFLQQVSAEEESRAGLIGGAASWSGRKKPRTSGQGRIGGARDPVRERPSDRGVQGPQSTPKTRGQRLS